MALSNSISPSKKVDRVSTEKMQVIDLRSHSLTACKRQPTESQSEVCGGKCLEAVASLEEAHILLHYLTNTALLLTVGQHIPYILLEKK